MSDLIVILGSGESGRGAATLAVAQGFSVFVSDYHLMDLKSKEHFEAIGVHYEEGKHSIEKMCKACLVIKSPGIPASAPILQELKAFTIPIISEIEFAGRYTHAKIIGITGSNGKTTCTLLTYHLLKQAGLHVGLAGNIGHSLAQQVATCDYDYYVVELSSFQLDDMYEFMVDIAILLNISPDHLDRYDYNIDKYIASKFRILNNQTAQEAFIYNIDDEYSRKYLSAHPQAATLYPFGKASKTHHNYAAWDTGTKLAYQLNGAMYKFEKCRIALQGEHNYYNTMAATLAALLCQVDQASITQALENFKAVEHRQELVAVINGITYINDSKATNVHASYYALECQTAPLIWIAGGIDKGNDYTLLYELAKEKVHTLICLGKDNNKLHNAFVSIIPNILKADNLETCFQLVSKLAQAGDTVLLSPACASFDLFKNYEDRGSQFKAATLALKQ